MSQARILVLADGDDHLTLNASFLESLDVVIVGDRIVLDRTGRVRNLSSSEKAVLGHFSLLVTT